jgi:hypothetical protein
VLNNPTIKQRRDWCQHFALSAALTVLGDADSAESAGIAKETLDMKDGGSGFSFADFGADYAGIAFAERVLETGEFLKAVREKFTVDLYVPKLDDLPDGLKRSKFEADYGGFTDKRYLDAIAGVKKRVRDLHPRK